MYIYMHLQDGDRCLIHAGIICLNSITKPANKVCIRSRFVNTNGQHYECRSRLWRNTCKVLLPACCIVHLHANTLGMGPKHVNIQVFIELLWC